MRRKIVMLTIAVVILLTGVVGCSLPNNDIANNETANNETGNVESNIEKVTLTASRSAGTAGELGLKVYGNIDKHASITKEADKNKLHEEENEMIKELEKMGAKTAEDKAAEAKEENKAEKKTTGTDKKTPNKPSQPKPKNDTPKETNKQPAKPKTEKKIEKKTKEKIEQKPQEKPKEKPVEKPQEKPEQKPQNQENQTKKSNSLQDEYNKMVSGKKVRSDIENEVINLMNKERKTPLKKNSDLTKLARIKSVDMAYNGYFAHNSPTYGQIWDMGDTYRVKYQGIAENIQYTTEISAEKVHNNFMNSPGHRDNRMDSGYKEVGVGIIEYNGLIYITEVFR